MLSHDPNGRHEGGERMSSALPAGTPVAGFTSSVIPRPDLSLSDLAGRQIAFAFSSVDWRWCAPISDPFVIDRHGSLFLSLLANRRHSWCRRHLDAAERLPNKGAPMGTLRVPVTQHDHIKGPANAPVTLVEYGDYECPHSGAAHPIVGWVLEHLDGKLRFVFRHFPLSQVHPLAEPAAKSAEFAGAHGRFREMHDGIYENQDRLGLPLLFVLAEALGLSEARLRDALISDKYTTRSKVIFSAACAAV
jgi:Thioredoxin